LSPSTTPQHLRRRAALAVDKFVATGAVFVTKENIDQPEAKNVLY
jgi:hypothetical protein